MNKWQNEIGKPFKLCYRNMELKGIVKDVDEGPPLKVTCLMENGSILTITSRNFDGQEKESPA